MAGSFAEARAQILSLRPGMMRMLANEARTFGAQATFGGSTLRASATRLGAQRGAPYQAYEERVTPTAGWLTDLARPTGDTGAALDAAAASGERAQMVLAQMEAALARYGSNPGTTPGAFAAAEAQALARLNTAIGEVTQAYGGVQPAPPTAAPVVAGGRGSDTASGRASTGANARSADDDAHGAADARTPPAGDDPRSPAGATAAGAGIAATGAGVAATRHTATAALGPTSGPFAGFVHDPTSGNLVDPGTGRQVDAGGRFLDPITGRPFGPASPFVSRLEGLDGGVSPFGGLLGGPGGAAASIPLVGALGAPGGGGAGGIAAGLAPFGLAPGGGVVAGPGRVGGLGAGGTGRAGAGGTGGAGAGGTGGAAEAEGAVPFLAGGGLGGTGGPDAGGLGAGGAAAEAQGAAPFLTGGLGGATAGARGTGFFAGLYGGVVPPSLAGENPAGAQLRQQAAENLSASAGTAQRYAAIASGQPQGAYPPPIGGVGAGGGGGGGARPRARSGARTDGEPAAVWGATGGGGDRRERRTPPASTDVEDAGIWDGGDAAPRRLDAC